MKDEEKWNKNYESAKEFYNKNGNLDIEQSYKTENGECLGTWIQRQRLAYKARYNIGKTKVKPLTDEKIKLLENIGMEWDPRLNKYSKNNINKNRTRLMELRAYKFLSKYAKEIKNEIETYEDVKKINDSFLDTMNKLIKK